MALSLEQARELADLMADLGADVEVRPGYSGRGMYGATTVAFVTDRPFVALVALGFAAAQMLDGDPDADADGGFSYCDLPTRVDQMGMGMVIY